MSTRPRRGQAVHELVGTSVWGFRKDLRGWHSGVVIDVQWWGSTGDALTGQFEPRLEFSDGKKQWCPRWSSTEVLLLPPPALTSPPAPTLPPVLSSSVVLQLSPPALSSLPALSLLPHESDAEADGSDDDADDGMFGSEDVSKAGEVGALAAAAKAAKKAASTALPSSLTLPPPPSPISWMPFPVIIDPALLGGSVLQDCTSPRDLSANREPRWQRCRRFSPEYRMANASQSQVQPTPTPTASVSSSLVRSQCMQVATPTAGKRLLSALDGDRPSNSAGKRQALSQPLASGKAVELRKGNRPACCVIPHCSAAVSMGHPVVTGLKVCEHHHTLISRVPRCRRSPCTEVPAGSDLVRCPQLKQGWRCHSLGCQVG